MPNPKWLDNEDLVDLIYQKNPAAFWRVASCCGIRATRKQIIGVYREVYK